MKKLSNLKGLLKLSKEAQKNISGGGRIAAICAPDLPVCPEHDPYCEELAYYNTWCVNR